MLRLAVDKYEGLSMELIAKILVAGGVMGVLDALWLSRIASSFYKNEIGGLLLAKPNMMAAIMFYVIYLIGVNVFVINPALDKGSWLPALGFGALFGFVAYATYDLTNLATVKGFSLKVAAVDMMWGAFLTATVSVVTYLVITKFFISA